ncbi:PaaI family thioesterase [Celeribacter neptunius]|uniref:Acyl-coenzyme A thioesterase PaaI, contains HGG motif n=1 Tax=Celeribacter neptunius TaxID=588602 RepID=A0A1I3WAI5_9RHOB|nr:PaaI family thioesterase [Celeribacter neptunius]SFK04535.1 Acyl-coenzyme A thioesterase PaaI, contains HGG motif [Celeribacter neptunius]
MNRPQPEPVQIVKERRDAALAALVARVPYSAFMGFQFERRGDELTGLMPYRPDLIGNPALPALHGGALAAFLETTALMALSWSMIWPRMEAGESVDILPKLPKTIDLTVDYLRSGLPRDAYARAEITRAGRRYASVQVEAWQDNRARPTVQAMGHFLMPDFEARS